MKHDDDDDDDDDDNDCGGGDYDDDSNKFILYLFMYSYTCLLNSQKANYKVSKTKKETKQTHTAQRKDKARQLVSFRQ
jgi:hypothetical protein